MSIIFGLRKGEGQAVEEPQLIHLASATGRYAPDGTFVRASGRLGMGFQPYYTHQRANLEAQPAVDARGNMLTFDGRLDNHADLCKLLNIAESDTADSLIVLAALDRWGEECFSRFVGDWALAFWSNTEQSLYLARDHAGTRTLYFEQTDGCVVWATYLESFFAEKTSRELDAGYAACYLACQPTRDLTPYKGIVAVTPAHYFVFHEGRLTRKAHWRWMVKDEIHYKTDAEYEEHLFSLFRQSVERRTGLGAPILAQLSGGMDSSSIVCMSDHIRTSQGVSSQGLIDTLSFYDDSEPNWDERPYFTAIETLRGKTGIHIDVSSIRPTFMPVKLPQEERPLLPGGDSGSCTQEEVFHRMMQTKDYRVFLSGMGGDEMLGGVPAAMPELADCLIACNLPALFRRAMPWCIHKQIPLLHMLWGATAFAIDTYRGGRPKADHMPPWITTSLRRLCFKLENKGVPPCGGGSWLPSRICSGTTWWSLVETLPSLYPAIFARREYRYPYLDRDLVDFLLRVPRAQLVHPGRRRYLMRRAFKTILPATVLERRRKAYIARAPSVSLEASQERIRDIVADSSLANYGYIDASTFQRKLTEVLHQESSQWRVSLMRTALFELWLRTSRTTHAPGAG